MPTYDDAIGWNSGTWGRGAWDSSLVNTIVDGLAATASVGTVTVTGDADTTPTGLSATAHVGTVTTTNDEDVFPTGLSATASVGTVVVSLPTTVSVTGLQMVISLGVVGVRGWSVVDLDDDPESWSEVNPVADEDWVVVPEPSAYTWS